MKINDAKTRMLVPRFMEDDQTVIGMCAAFDYLTKRVIEKMKLVNLFENLEILEEETLDYIAKKEEIEWYDTSYSKEQKINIIRNAERNCMFVGTASSVERVVKDMMGEGIVEEWFDYDGKPYHFKIKTDAAIGDDVNNLVAKLVKRVKRTRTILDTVEIEKVIKADVSIGAGIYQYSIPGILKEG